MQDRPSLFVLGNPRSGTTVLRLALSAHPELCIPPECGFALWLHERFSEGPFPDRLAEFFDAVVDSRKFSTWGLAREELDREAEHGPAGDYATAVGAVYRAYARKLGKPGALLGDKNNFYVEMIDLLHSAFPAATVAWITRDPRDVFCSYRELQQRALEGRFAPRLEERPGEFARKWNEVMDQREKAQRLFGERFVAIRYEDLVRSPAEVLGGVLRKLGLEFDERVLRFHESSDEPEEFLAWKEKVREPFSDRMVGRHLRDLDDAERATIEGIAGERMVTVGYEPGS